MAERARHWIKLWVAWLTTPAHVELTGAALGLGPLLLLLATWDGEHDSGGWLLAEDGSPISREALARATHRTRQQLDRELAELVKCRTLTVRDDGAIGFARYGHWQETSSATRTRRYRERHRDAQCDATGDGDVRAQFVICDAQTEDGRREINKPPPTPPPAEGGQVLVSPSAAPAKPRRGKPRRTPPDGFAEQCFEVLVSACRELSTGTAAGPRRLTAGMRDSLAKLYAAEEPSPAEWALAVRRRLELDRAGDRYGSLTWEHLCRPASFRRYRDAVDAGSADAAPVDLDALGDLPDWDPAGAEP